MPCCSDPPSVTHDSVVSSYVCFFVHDAIVVGSCHKRCMPSHVTIWQNLNDSGQHCQLSGRYVINNCHYCFSVIICLYFGSPVVGLSLFIFYKFALLIFKCLDVSREPFANKRADPRYELCRQSDACHVRIAPIIKLLFIL